MASEISAGHHNPHHSSSLPLQDRVAIVTGSSRGIGRAIALHLAELGARVAVNYVSNSSQGSKAAVETMTKILAKELKGSRIAANCIAPEPTAPDMFFAGTSEALKRQLMSAQWVGLERKRMWHRWWVFWPPMPVNGLMGRLFVLREAYETPIQGNYHGR